MRRLKFIDETWAATNMTRLYGRAPVGQRLVCPVPHGHCHTTTFVACLGLEGMTAPLVIDGARTGDLFEAYVKQVLVPTLTPGDIVIADRLAAHKRAGARQAIEAAGVRARPHGLRHAAITEALELTGGDVRRVQRFSRHRSLQTLLRYDDNRQDLAGGVARRLVEGLERFLGSCSVVTAVTEVITTFLGREGVQGPPQEVPEPVHRPQAGLPQ